MSSRSIKKRRHREDFQGYMHQRTVDRVAGGPMWKRAGFPTQEMYLKYLESKPKDSQMQLPPAHVHGPECHHDHLPQEVANAMSDDEWLEEPRLTAEEHEAIVNADSQEGEPF